MHVPAARQDVKLLKWIKKMLTSGKCSDII